MEPEKLGRRWLTLAIRLSVFPVSRWEAPVDLWERVVGAPPETVQSQPRQETQSQEGPWEGGVLHLITTPILTTWTALVSPSDQGLPALDSWPVEEVLPKFKAVTRPWLVSADFEIKRLGFGLHTLLSAADRGAAYELLDDLVESCDIDPEQTSDLMYQINRPVPSQVLGEGVRLNRLMKWSAPSFRVGALQVTPAGLVQAGPLSGDIYAGLENDVNTPGDRLEPFGRELLGPIYDELAELAWKNLEFGEKA